MNKNTLIIQNKESENRSTHMMISCITELALQIKGKMINCFVHSDRK